MTRERWKPILGFEGYYEVSNLGNIRSLDRVIMAKDGRAIRYRGRPLKQTLGPDGYLSITLYVTALKKRRWMYVHTAVMEAFVGPLPDGLCTRHLNSNKLDNRRKNLRYGTYYENAMDTLEQQNFVREPRPRMSKHVVLRVFKAVQKNRIRDVAKQFGIGVNTVRRIRDGDTHANVTQHLRG